MLADVYRPGMSLADYWVSEKYDGVRGYWDGKGLWTRHGTRVQAPMGVAAFPDPVFLPSPRSFVEKTYDVVHWTEMPKGGHFAALEEPDLMLGDLRAFVGTVAGERR